MSIKPPQWSEVFSDFDDRHLKEGFGTNMDSSTLTGTGVLRSNTVRNLRYRYIVGLSFIALLITASYFTMQKVISEQVGYSSLVNLAGHQAGLSNRIAYFASIMVTTQDEAEFSMARSQVGRTMNKMKNSYQILRQGDPKQQIPLVSNDNLQTIYADPMFGLDNALENFFSRVEAVYDMEMEALHPGFVSYIFITTYGPHVLEPLLDAAVEEYDRIGEAAIAKIEKFEMVIWLATLITLICEVLLIFRPFERQIRQSFLSLGTSIQELRATRERLLEAQKIAKVGDWEWNLKGGEYTWSDQIYEMSGLDKDLFVPSKESCLRLVHPDDRTAVRRLLTRVIETGLPDGLEFRVVLPDLTEKLVYQYVIFKGFKDGGLVLGTIQDITERRELSIRLEKLSNQIPGFMFQFQLDPLGKMSVVFVSRGIVKTAGIGQKAVQQDIRQFWNLVHPDQLGRVVASFSESGEKMGTWREQFQVKHPERGYIWLEGQASPERLADGSTLWYGYLGDITERKKSESQIRKLALYDPLTGLANRRLLKDRLSHALATSQRNKNYGAVLILDLDNFKSLNDSQGHNVGDALLVEVAQRINGCVRETDTTGRLGGDEFVVVLEWLGSSLIEAKRKAIEVAEKIRLNLCRSYRLGEREQQHTHHTTCSIGVTVFQGSSVAESELLKQADVAMYEAKDLGRNRACLFSERRQAIVNRKSELAGNLQYALDHEEFSVFLQPQISRSGRLHGAEALVRWFPPGKEPVSPGTFIPVAESTGLILPLGEWVLRKTAGYLRELEREELATDLSLSVNISARQFSDEDFLNKIEAIISSSGIAPRQLRLELTETCLIHDLKRTLKLLTHLREMGIAIELDDFGTGYSSLNSLNQLPLNTLKLDRSLIRDLDSESCSKAIVRAALAMARAMSLETIAEGVESYQQSEFLVKEGCDAMQGFLFAKPMSFDKFRVFLEGFESNERCVVTRWNMNNRGKDFVENAIAAVN